MTPVRRNGHRSLIIPSIAAALGFAFLLGLGFWQLERKEWKEKLIADLTERLSAAPADLPASDEWPKLTRDNSEFRRVKLRVEFVNMSPAYFYTGGSALRDDVKAPGYFMFVPARLASGQLVVINTGYVPDPQFPWTGGSAEIVGYLRWPESPGWFVSDHDASASTWFVRDHAAMTKVKNWGERTAPFYIDQESPVPAGGLPKPGPLSVKLRNDHLGYALTWFGLAAALAVIFALFVAQQSRKGAQPASL